MLFEQNSYCEQIPSETPCLFNQIYSMIQSTKLSEYLYEMATGENWLESNWRERERKKESSGLMEWETEHWKDLEMDTWVLKIDQINRTNKMSIK
jgi:hypothetical protein